MKVLPKQTLQVNFPTIDFLQTFLADLKIEIHSESLFMYDPRNVSECYFRLLYGHSTTPNDLEF
jgi:hypothetical protein